MSTLSPFEAPESEIELSDREAFGTKLKRLSGIASTIGVSLGVFGFFAIQGIVLARMLGPIGRGEFAVVNLYGQALLYVCMLGAPEIFARLAATRNEDASIRRSALRYATITGLFTIAVCSLLSAMTIKSDQRYLLPMAVICSAAAAAQQIRIAVQSVDHGKRAMFRYNVCRLVAGSLFPIGLLVGWAIGASDVRSAAWILLVTSIMAIGLCQWGMTESWIGESMIGVAEALQSAKSLVGSIVINELMERSDMILVVWFLSATQLDRVGAYAAAVPIASVMLIFPNAVSLYVFNRAARPDEVPKLSELWSTFGTLLGIQVIFGLALIFAIPYFLPFLYGERFETAVAFAQSLIPAAALRGLLQAGDAYLRARGLSRHSIPPRVMGLILIYATTFIAWPWMGPFAVPLGLTLAQLLCCVLIVFAIQRDIKSLAQAST